MTLNVLLYSTFRIRLGTNYIILEEDMAWKFFRMKYPVVNRMVSFQTVFVTVGTTKFDSLMEVMNTEDFQRVLQQRFGTTRLVVQFGKSKTRPSSMY